MAPLVLTSELEENSLSERKEIYYDGSLYDVTQWIAKHPGGKIIEYYTDLSEDATIPIQQFHHRSIKQVLAKMRCLPRRSGIIPAVCGKSERHQKLTEDFQKLFQELQAEGYFEPSVPNTIFRILEILLYFALGFYFSNTPSIGIFFAVLVGQRSGFLTHEAGHGSLTGNTKLDKCLEVLAMTLLIGLSSKWWSSQHNRHHAMPQRLDRDIDLDTLPLVAFNSKIALRSHDGNNFFTRHQAKLFYTIDTFLVAMYWQWWLNPKYVLHKRQYSQLVFLALHYCLVFWLVGFINYLIILWITSILLFGTFTLSHSHLPVTTESLHWVEYALLHTTNVDPSWWCDWIMGYLNYQIEHHLFPTMPQFRQRQVAGRVRALAERHALPYQCISYVEAIKRAVANLSQVSVEIVKLKTL